MQFYFGHSDSQLFGVYHAGRVRNASRHAVLVCPPIGQEFVRTHWSLRLLASQLSRKGINVMRMDYSGIGDSWGSVEDVVSLGIWQNDIDLAIEELCRRSGAETVMLLGLRFGAALAAEIANSNDRVNSVVFWEPVVDGKAHLDELRRMQEQMLDLWVCKMETPNDEVGEEILGTYYPRKLVEEMEQCKLDAASISQPQFIIQPKESENQFTHPEPTLQKVTTTEDQWNWDDLDVLETAWLRPQTTRIIVGTIEDMFKRLVRFNALSLPVLPTSLTAYQPNHEDLV